MTSVVTPERFSTGKSFQEYMESGIKNRELFEKNYHGLTVSPEQEAALKALVAKPNGPRNLLVIGEDWCPDVYRGTGVAAKIAEAAGLEYRFFERDQNKDIMAEHLNKGEFESVPVFVFYDKDFGQLVEFIERPQRANDEMPMMRGVMGDTTPEGIAKRLGHEPSEEEIAAARAEARQKYMDWQDGPIWAGWRVATVDEIIERLQAATA